MSLQSTSMLRSGASHLASAAPSGAAVGYVYIRDKDTATSVPSKYNGSTTPFHPFIRSLEAYLDKQPGKKGKSSKNFKKKQARSVELTDGTSVAADADAGGKQLKKSALVMVLASASLLQITEVNQSTLTRCLPLPTSLYHCLTPQSLKMLWRLCQST